MQTIATLSELAHAQLLQSALESAGIPTFMPDELTAQNAPPYLWASGGVRLQVPDEHAENARAIIAALESGDAPSPDNPTLT